MTKEELLKELEQPKSKNKTGPAVVAVLFTIVTIFIVYGVSKLDKTVTLDDPVSQQQSYNIEASNQLSRIENEILVLETQKSKYEEAKKKGESHIVKLIQGEEDEPKNFLEENTGTKEAGDPAPPKEEKTKKEAADDPQGESKVEDFR